MTSLSVVIGDEIVYQGPTSVVPRVGDLIRHGKEALRVESALWDLTSNEGAAAVTLEVSAQTSGY